MIAPRDLSGAPDRVQPIIAAAIRLHTLTGGLKVWRMNSVACAG
jgi:hypothetical protein